MYGCSPNSGVSSWLGYVHYRPTKWVAIYCWVLAWDGMGSLPENIMGLGSGPNGWPGPDTMGSYILLGIGLGWNGWLRSGPNGWPGPDKMGRVLAWDGIGSLPENILGLGSGPNGPDKMGSHILLGIGLGWNGWPAGKYSGDGVWTKMGRNIFLGISPGQNGEPVRKYSGD
ncbi:hypothetical protein BYT27DRAFT_7214723 [Phlegmacium glaucopus]|nr:hypothetical protein BYT27DRAFT_7214723 [Phlegmacium glaucopus]